MSLFEPGRRPRASALAVVLSTCLYAGCGFHLRGAVAYPPSMAVTHIAAEDRYTPFYQQLKRSLRLGGVQVTQDPDRADAVLRILADETGQRVLSVSARNTPNEYDVYYAVRYSLDVGGKEAIPAQTLAVNREYSYDETLVLGMQAQEDEIREALAGDLVGVVTQRLSSVK